MKKIGLLLAVVFAAFITKAQVQTVFFSEDFNNAGTNNYDPLNLPGWTVDTVDFPADGQRIWNYYFDGSGVAHVSAYGMDADTTEAWLITPQITLTNTGYPIVLNFDLKISYAVEDPVQHQFRVLISTDYDGSDFLSATWDTLQYIFDPDDYSDFATVTLDISDYAGQSVYIAFVYNGSNGTTQYTTRIRIDNVEVHDVPPIPYFTNAYTLNDTSFVLIFDKDASQISMDSLILSSGLGTIKNASFVDLDTVKDTLLIVTNEPMVGDGVIDTVIFTTAMDTIMFYGGVMPLRYLNPADPEYIGTNQIVAVRGTVVYEHSRGFILSDGEGPYHNMEMFDFGYTIGQAPVGSQVLFNAKTTQYYSYPELTGYFNLSLQGLINVELTPVMVDDPSIFAMNVNTDPTSEAMSYVVTLVKISVTVDSANYIAKKAFGPAWQIYSDTLELYVDDRYYNDDAVTFDALSFTPGSTYDIVGFVGYTYGRYTINPRSSADITLVPADVRDVNLNLSVFPNPATDYIIVKGDNLNKVEIYNTAGQLVKAQLAAGQLTSINVSGLPSAIYIVKVYTDKGVKTVNVIKQ